MTDDFPLIENGRTMTIRRRPLLIVALIVVVVIVILLVTTIYFAHKSTSKGGGGKPTPSITALPCPCSYFNHSDGIGVRWYPRANTVADLANAFKGGYHMVGAEVTASAGGPLVGVMALEEWLDKVMAQKIGIMLSMPDDIHVKENSAIIQSLSVLRKYRPLNRPIYISATILSLNPDTRHVNRSNFFAAIKELLPEVRLSLGIMSDTSGTALTAGDVETFTGWIKPLSQSVTLEMDPVLVRNSWSVLRPWLLNFHGGGIILTPLPSTTNPLSEYELLMMRNDCDENLLLYNMVGPVHDRLLKLYITGQSPVLAYSIKPRDASKIVWKHAVDDQERLTQTLNDPSIQMIEADIRMGNETGTTNTNIPIMQHDPYKTSDLTFETFLKRVLPSMKGMKFDFKDLESVAPVLNMTREHSDSITVPVWVNADILKGPGGGDVTMTPAVFLKDAELFPPVTLSLGWTTGVTTDNYTMAMVSDMHNICKVLKQPVTFPVRAMLLKQSIEAFQWLLAQSRGYTLTVWTGANDTVSRDDMNYVQRHTESSRVYFDLPADLMPNAYE